MSVIQFNQPSQGECIVSGLDTSLLRGVRTLIDPTFNQFLPNGEYYGPMCNKTFVTTNNMVIDNQDMLIIVNLMANGPVLGYIYVRSENTWKYKKAITTIESIATFTNLMTICSELAIYSNTISTTNANLSGSINAVCFTNLPRVQDISYDSIVKYTMGDQYCACGVPLAEGVVLHSFATPRQKLTDKNAILSPYVAEDFYDQKTFTETGYIPIDPMFWPAKTWTVTAKNVEPNLPLKVGFNITEGGVTTHDLRLINDGDTMTFEGPNIGDNVTGMRLVVVFDGHTSAEISLKCTDPIIGGGDQMRHVAIIQGSIGVKNITIAGKHKVAFTPTVSILPQVEVHLPIAYNPAVFELYNALIETHNYKLIMTRSEFARFVKMLLQCNDANLLSSAINNTGHASVAGLIGSLVPVWKGIVSGLSSYGLNPANLLRKAGNTIGEFYNSGLNYLESAGYASSVGHCSSANNKIKMKISKPIDIPDTLYSAELLEEAYVTPNSEKDKMLKTVRKRIVANDDDNRKRIKNLEVENSRLKVENQLTTMRLEETQQDLEFAYDQLDAYEQNSVPKKQQGYHNKCMEKIKNKLRKEDIDFYSDVDACDQILKYIVDLETQLEQAVKSDMKETRECQEARDDYTKAAQELYLTQKVAAPNVKIHSDPKKYLMIPRDRNEWRRKRRVIFKIHMVDEKVSSDEEDNVGHASSGLGGMHMIVSPPEDSWEMLEVLTKDITPTLQQYVGQPTPTVGLSPELMERSRHANTNPSDLWKVFGNATGHCSEMPQAIPTQEPKAPEEISQDDYDKIDQQEGQNTVIDSEIDKQNSKETGPKFTPSEIDKTINESKSDNVQSVQLQKQGDTVSKNQAICTFEVTAEDVVHKAVDWYGNKVIYQFRNNEEWKLDTRACFSFFAIIVERKIENKVLKLPYPGMVMVSFNAYEGKTYASWGRFKIDKMWQPSKEQATEFYNYLTGEPRLVALYNRLKGQGVNLYVTLLPSKACPAQALDGLSWTGAFMAALFARDPLNFYEGAVTATHWTSKAGDKYVESFYTGLIHVGDLEKKIAVLNLKSDWMNKIIDCVGRLGMIIVVQPNAVAECVKQWGTRYSVLGPINIGAGLVEADLYLSPPDLGHFISVLRPRVVNLTKKVSTKTVDRVKLLTTISSWVPEVTVKVHGKPRTVETLGVLQQIQEYNGENEARVNQKNNLTNLEPQYWRFTKRKNGLGQPVDFKSYPEEARLQLYNQLVRIVQKKLNLDTQPMANANAKEELLAPEEYEIDHVNFDYVNDNAKKKGRKGRKQGAQGAIDLTKTNRNPVATSFEDYGDVEF